MAALKFYLDRRSVRKDGTAPLKLSVTHKGKSALFNLNVHIAISQWDEKSGKIINHPSKAFLNGFLTRRNLCY